jgi:hypothetical protein
MKTSSIFLLIALLMLGGCGKKVSLQSEFDVKNYKADIESIYADSSNKKTRDILLNYIEDNLGGKIKFNTYEIGSRKDKYDYILNNYANQYDKWKQGSEEINKILNINLKKIDKDRNLFFELKNLSSREIVNVDFALVIENKSGNKLFQEYFSIAEKIPSNSSINTNTYSSQSDLVSNMDFKSLVNYYYVSTLSFSDGSIINLPSQFRPQ